MKQAITDEEVWLIKLLWFQGWSVEAFGPWRIEELVVRDIHRFPMSPVYQSAQHLSQAARLPTERIEQHLDNFKNRGWLASSSNRPYEITNQRRLLRLIVDAQSNRQRTAYRQIHGPSEPEVRGCTKRYGIPVFFIPRMLSMSFFGPYYTGWELFGQEREFWQFYRHHLEQHARSPADGISGILIHLLGQDFRFHEVYNHTHPDLETTIGALSLEECDEDDANVFICDSSQWPMSIGWAAHVHDKLYVDLMQGYIDFCTFGQDIHPDLLPWLETILCGKRAPSSLPETPSSDLTTR
jgi:hypothetical protein